MKLHLGKLEVVMLICDRYGIPYDKIENDEGKMVGVLVRSKDVEITWEGNEDSGYPEKSEELERKIILTNG